MSSVNCTVWGPKQKNQASFSGAIQTALIAMIIFSPFLFTFVNRLFSPILGTNFIAVNGKATFAGLIIHGLVAFLISLFINYYTMNPNEPAKLCCEQANQ